MGREYGAVGSPWQLRRVQHPRHPAERQPWPRILGGGLSRSPTGKVPSECLVLALSLSLGAAPAVALCGEPWVRDGDVDPPSSALLKWQRQPGGQRSVWGASWSQRWRGAAPGPRPAPRPAAPPGAAGTESGSGGPSCAPNSALEIKNQSDYSSP